MKKIIKKEKSEDACKDTEERCGFLNIDGTEYKTILSSKFKKRTNWEMPNENNVSSVIPGTILELFVKVGDKIEQGTPLLILEAMKMQNKVVSPKKGVVKEILVKVQQSLPKGELMIVIE